jgi:hypothetical protein
MVQRGNEGFLGKPPWLSLKLCGPKRRPPERVRRFFKQAKYAERKCPISTIIREIRLVAA